MVSIAYPKAEPNAVYDVGSEALIGVLCQVQIPFLPMEWSQLPPSPVGAASAQRSGLHPAVAGPPCKHKRLKRNQTSEIITLLATALSVAQPCLPT